MKDPAFPVKEMRRFNAGGRVKEEEIVHPGLSKLEYAAIHIAAAMVPAVIQQAPIETDEILLARFIEADTIPAAVEVAIMVLAACE